eukprot:7347376-Pyramimonas_sp.AAC.1
MTLRSSLRLLRRCDAWPAIGPPLPLWGHAAQLREGTARRDQRSDACSAAHGRRGSELCPCNPDAPKPQQLRINA